MINKILRTPPFSINEENVNVDENIRLKYRYLGFYVVKSWRKHLKMRHQITRSIRQYLDDEGFFDIETPVLTEVNT